VSLNIFSVKRVTQKKKICRVEYSDTENCNVDSPCIYFVLGKLHPRAGGTSTRILYIGKSKTFSRVRDLFTLSHSFSIYAFYWISELRGLFFSRFSQEKSFNSIRNREIGLQRDWWLKNVVPNLTVVVVQVSKRRDLGKFENELINAFVERHSEPPVGNSSFDRWAEGYSSKKSKEILREVENFTDRVEVVDDRVAA
jgi:hypothetical protein